MQVEMALSFSPEALNVVSNSEVEVNCTLTLKGPDGKMYGSTCSIKINK